MTEKRKTQITLLLKSIQTGDVQHTAVVNEAKYIQHNPQTKEGGIGLAELFSQLSKTNPRVEIVRIFSDGDFVFGHTEYDFSSRRIGFEIFRFEGDQAVEHWDNIQTRIEPNLSGRTMVDGETTLCDLDKTEINRALVKELTETVLINQQFDQLDRFISRDDFHEHSPARSDDVGDWVAALSGNKPDMRYIRTHRILADGNFTLVVSEGIWQEKEASFYDLYRLDAGKIVEHWDTMEKIPPRESWQNQNGKF